MFKKICKRNSEIADFDPKKITKAILKAGEATGEFGLVVAEKLTLRVLGLAQSTVLSALPSVEEIQDIVEEVLISSIYRKSAKAFIIYRDQHSKIREIVSKSGVDLIDKYLEKLDWQVNENSNMTYSLQGLNNYIASEISKTYWLNKIYPPDIKDLHQKGDIHIHDLGQLSVYCVGWDLKDLLLTGFRGVKGKIACRPAKHFHSILGQVVNFFYTLQGEASGAQAFASFDTLIAPFVHYDNLEYKQVKQAIQEFVYNTNVPTRVGFQTPFTNITMDLVVPSSYRDEAVIVGGKMMDKTYGDFQDEMNMVNRAFLEVMSSGDADGRVFTFPIPTYNITKDFDWENPVLDYLWEATAKYGIPYFSNFVNSDMDPNDIRSMCCRLNIDTSKLAVKGGGLFGSNPLTGSVGVVTVNMPRIGYLAEDEDDFMERLSILMDKSRESLEIKRKVLEKYTDASLYPYSKFYLRGIKQRSGKYWVNHFSTVGLVGMNETCINLFGKDIGTQQGTRFAERVMDFMRDRLREYQAETGNNYNLEATPAEGTTYRLANLDKKYFKNIITAKEAFGDSASDVFYTNSTHLPVNYSDDLFEILDKQDNIQSKYTGGTVIHLFGGEKISSKVVVKNLVKRICDTYQLPYFSITPTFSICPNHNYLVGEQKQCPDCGETCEVYSRVVGYLRPISQWNVGKKSEFAARKMVRYE